MMSGKDSFVEAATAMKAEVVEAVDASLHQWCVERGFSDEAVAAIVTALPVVFVGPLMRVYNAGSKDHKRVGKIVSRHLLAMHDELTMSAEKGWVDDEEEADG